MNWTMTVEYLKGGYRQTSLNIVEFCKFISKEARISCNPVTSLQALKADENKERGENSRAKYTSRDKLSTNLRTFAISSSERNPDTVKERSPGTFCKDNHELDSCAKYLKISLLERRKFIQANALCWGCLKWGHTSKECRGRQTCRTCSRRHPTSLHNDSAMQDEPPNQGNREPVRRNTISLVEPTATLLAVVDFLQMLQGRQK